MSRIGARAWRSLAVDDAVSVGGGPWRMFKVGEAACQKGCEDVAIAIQKQIGGKIGTIDAGGRALGGIRDFGGRRFRNPAGQGHAWFEHHVVIKDGKVFDALTGPVGQPIEQYKSR